MAAKKRGLGKGLDALLSPRSDSEISSINAGDQLRNLPVDLMQRGQYQPRKEMDKDALHDLSESIKAQGLVQPILVRPLNGGNKYEIIAGERRWRAAQLAGLHQVPVVIRDVPDQAAMCIALIENIQREDLNPLEEAQALHRLLEEFEMTHEAAAEAVGRSRSTVSNMLRLLELEAKVKDLLQSRDLEMGHARALLSLTGQKQVEVALLVVKKELSVRETEALVKRQLSQKTKNKSNKNKTDPNVLQLQDSLSERLATKVEIKYNKKGKGELKIHYSSLDELDGILERIK